MLKQRIGKIAWDETYKGERFYGLKYCIGHCPGCKMKQVIGDDEILEFNRHGPKLKPSRVWGTIQSTKLQINFSIL